MYDPERWMRFLEQSRDEIGIPDWASLCRAAGLRSQSIVNRWREGQQPNNEVIRKLAPVLGVSVRTLLVEAGHFEEHQMIGGVALERLMESPILDEERKQRILEEWRDWDNKREKRFRRFLERLNMQREAEEETGAPGDTLP
jgi:transcriptional regulator with XRE-family HTH domain